MNGIVDPFLQVQILRVFRQMAKGDEGISDEISEVLALVFYFEGDCKQINMVVIVGSNKHSFQQEYRKCSPL